MQPHEKKYEAELDWLRLSKDPVIWVTVSAIIFITVLILGGSYYVRSFNNIYENMLAPVEVQRSNFPDKDLEQKPPVVVEGVNLVEVSSPNEELLAKGKEVYNANCSSCHGSEGKGDGAGGEALNPKPRSFHDADGWTNGSTLSEMYITVEEGIEGTGMIAYEFLPVKDRIATLYYIRTFADHFPPVGETELEDLDMLYNISGGKYTAPQIPVARAKEILAANSIEVIKEIKSLADYIINHPGEPGADVFRQVCYEKLKALNLLYNNRTWLDNIETFKGIITAEPVNNGFNTSATMLNSEDWQSLHSYLARFFANQ